VVGFARHENRPASYLLEYIHDHCLVRKYRKAPLFAVIVVSWLTALAEYCFQVPANRIGYGEFTAFQLKIIQGVIALSVFAAFAVWYLGESIKWNYAVSFLFLIGAVAFAFRGKM
jgi:uncharacterized protein